MPKRFIAVTPFTQLHHFARYLKAITERLDKIRADPARDGAKSAELRPSERKGAVDDRMMEFRWLL